MVEGNKVRSGFGASTIKVKFRERGTWKISCSGQEEKK